MENGISVIIITRNEALTIGKALASVREFADQVVLVDTGSTDDTLRIAREHPQQPEIHQTPWQNDFSAVRNLAISLCKHAWCLVLDGDEYIDESCRPNVRRLIESKMGEDSGLLYAPLIDNLNGSLLRNNPRIFSRRETLRYTGRVHEYLRDSRGAGVACLHEIIIKHSGYLPDIYQQKNKYSRNKALLEMQISEEPDSFRWKYFHLRYMEIPSPEALSVLHEFGRLPMPFESDTEVYAFNAKSRLIQCLLEEGCWEEAQAQASELYRYYSDYDTTLLYIAATLRSARSVFENIIADCNEKLVKTSALMKHEYLHESTHPSLRDRLQDELTFLCSRLLNAEEK